jgi:sigma-54 dependent transcriptional regulator, acetoin dehydrogenase operon transcriptional activator AcoR
LATTLIEEWAMAVTPLVPVARGGQRLTEQQWQAAMSGQLTLASARPIVRASWERSRRTNVSPSLRRAPLALGDEALSEARERVDWLPFARRAVDQLHGSYGIEHVLTMFDAQGHMLSAEGAPGALEGLADINFRPGGDWSEALVGTNGPGTALALGVPVHIVGDEHFCQRWQQWHCAAVPLRDQVTGAALGVLDLSGHRDFAHPHTLDLVVALAWPSSRCSPPAMLSVGTSSFTG